MAAQETTHAGGAKAQTTGGVQFEDSAGTNFGVERVENRLRVSVMDYYDEMSEGHISGHTPIRIGGQNTDIGLAWEDVSCGGNETLLTVATLLYASSSDAGDTEQTILVYGLGSDWNLQYGSTLVQGQSQVAIQTGGVNSTWLRVFEVWHLSETELLGDLYIAELDDLTLGVPDTAAKIHGKICIGDGRSLKAAFTIPDGMVGYITSFHCFALGKKDVFIRLRRKAPNEPWQTTRPVGMNSATYYEPFDMPMQLTARTDVKCDAKGLETGVIAGSGFEGWIEEI